jgi:hypothetical protein
VFEAIKCLCQSNSIGPGVLSRSFGSVDRLSRRTGGWAQGRGFWDFGFSDSMGSAAPRSQILSQTSERLEGLAHRGTGQELRGKSKNWCTKEVTYKVYKGR